MCSDLYHFRKKLITYLGHFQGLFFNPVYLVVLCIELCSGTELFYTEECQNINKWGAGAILAGMVGPEHQEVSPEDIYIRNTLSRCLLSKMERISSIHHFQRRLVYWREINLCNSSVFFLVPFTKRCKIIQYMCCLDW